MPHQEEVVHQVGSETINEHRAWQLIISSRIVCHNWQQLMPHLGCLTTSRQNNSHVWFFVNLPWWLVSSSGSQWWALPCQWRHGHHELKMIIDQGAMCSLSCIAATAQQESMTSIASSDTANILTEKNILWSVPSITLSRTQAGWWAYGSTEQLSQIFFSRVGGPNSCWESIAR